LALFPEPFADDMDALDDDMETFDELCCTLEDCFDFCF
jgi:hypothetical protein